MSERRRVSSGSPWEPKVGICRALRDGDRVLVSGTAPIWPDGSCVPDAAVQTRRCLEIITTALGELDAEAAHGVRTRMFITDAADGEAIASVHSEFFGAAPPVSTMVVVSGFLDPRWRVEIEAEAMSPLG